MKVRTGIVAGGFALALLGAQPAPAAADASAPFAFAAFNQGALARHALLPTPDGSAAAGPGVVLDWTSESHVEQSGSELLRLDGEILRLGLRQRWDWDSAWGAWQITAELPVLITGGGVLDSAIETWHDWFALPNGSRDALPRDEYRYQYQRNGATVFDIGGSDTEIGDLRLGAAHCREGSGCWRAMAQLPTGDADRLLGGGAGLAGWYERPYTLGSAARWRGVLAAGASGVAGDGPLEAQQTSFVPFGWAALGYAITPALEAGAQLYAHGPLYNDSNLGALTRNGLQLVFGARYRSAAGTWWSLAFQEDLITQSSPDFVIHLSVSR